VSPRQPLPHQRERERAVLDVILLDVVGGFGVLIFGLLDDSLTLIADGTRGVLLLFVEVYAWIMLRRIHRGRFSEYDFGTGKIERVVNVAIALGLLVAVASIVVGGFFRVDHQPSSSALLFATAVFFAEFNLLVNLYGLVAFARANRDQPSIIIESQISARLVKSLSSFAVFLILLASGVIPDPTVSNFLDILGSFFVCIVMARTAMQQLRESVPDLLDRSLADDVQVDVYRVLAANFDRYDDVVAVRSRRSGRELLIDVELGFGKDATVEQLTALGSRLTDEVRARLPDARVKVVPSLSRWLAVEDPAARDEPAARGDLGGAPTDSIAP
jgi:divalent metal cation (Fe/Co/Zn/Cd) transporter